MDTFEILSQLCSAAGVSGAEDSAAKTAAKLLEKYGEVTLDNALGSVICKVGSWEEVLHLSVTHHFLWDFQEVFLSSGV